MPNFKPSISSLSDFMPTHRVEELIRAALTEDIGSGDITTIGCLGAGASRSGQAILVAKADGIICGLGIFAAVFETLDPDCAVAFFCADGDPMAKGTTLAKVSGPYGALLTAERTALNFIGRLSGIATLTAQFVSLAHGQAQILDTRKTTPGWRALEKYAVRCGGGENHRLGLFDMALVKDNHISAAGSISSAVENLRRYLESADYRNKHSVAAPNQKIVIAVEVRTEDELREALTIGVNRILIDNQTPERLTRWIALAKSAQENIVTEASGNITLENVSAYAQSGVNYISIGALTHSAPILDLSLKISQDNKHR